MGYLELSTKKFIVIALLLVIFGWCVNDLYSSYRYTRSYNGLHIRPPGEMSHEEIQELARTRDKFGNWICINVRDMKYSQVVDTCIHEAAHEVFARIIESEPEKINKVFEVIEEDDE